MQQAGLQLLLIPMTPMSMMTENGRIVTQDVVSKLYCFPVYGAFADIRIFYNSER